MGGLVLPAMIGGWTTTCRSSPSDLARRRALVSHPGTARHGDLTFFGEVEQDGCAVRRGIALLLSPSASRSCLAAAMSGSLPSRWGHWDFGNIRLESRIAVT